MDVNYDILLEVCTDKVRNNNAVSEPFNHNGYTWGFNGWLLLGIPEIAGVKQGDFIIQADLPDFTQKEWLDVPVVKDESKVNIKIGKGTSKIPFTTHAIQVIGKLPNVRIALTGRYSAACLTFDGGIGYLMPATSEKEYKLYKTLKEFCDDSKYLAFADLFNQGNFTYACSSRMVIAIPALKGIPIVNPPEAPDMSKNLPDAEADTLFWYGVQDTPQNGESYFFGRGEYEVAVSEQAIRLLLKLPGTKIAPRGGNRVAWLKFDGGMGYVMPLSTRRD